MSKILSMTFDLKEDLRLRMADLEKKLAESEEERSKMEKTCNALMRSFREQERMRYIALNKRYEKFLQDCTMRKKRNETVLRSLCRIEDRSKALFAKTERLKLLKNRYIAYLKISNVKKDETSSQFSSFSQKPIDDVTPKTVRWKTPLATDQNLEKIEDLLYSRTSDVVSDVLNSRMTSAGFEKHKQQRSEKIEGYEGRKDSERIDSNKTFHTEVPKNKLNLFEIGSDLAESLADSLSIHHKDEKLFRGNNQRKPEDDFISEHEISNGNINDKKLLVISGSVMSQQESVDKLELKEEYSDKEDSYKKRYSYDGKAVGKNDIESIEKDVIKKQSNLEDELTPRISHRFVPFRSIDITHDEEKDEGMSKNAEKEMKAHSQKEETSKSLPMGLDGIDYHNETYPESYYEQPVYHHNHTNIAVDVILEEDENEQNGDEEEEEKEKEDVTAISHEGSHGSSICVDSSENIILNEPNLRSSSNKGYAIDANCFDKSFDPIKSQKSDSEKNSEAEQSDLGTDESKRYKKESLVSDKSISSPKKIKSPVKSNLIHLLESDSESYQIEHGDGVSENEVSDFDLSFH